MADPLKKLTHRHKIFIDVILSGSTGADAARIAGFKAKNLSDTSNRLLKDPIIIAEIEKSQREIAKNTEANEREIALRLTRIARGDEEASSNTVRALELLAKIKGMMIDRVETKNIGVGLVDKVISGDNDSDVVRIA